MIPQLAVIRVEEGFRPGVRPGLHNKELAAVGIPACVRHGQSAPEIVEVRAEFVLEIFAPDGLAASSGSFRIAALNHKVVDDPVELHSVIVPFLA